MRERGRERHLAPAERYVYRRARYANILKPQRGGMFIEGRDTQIPFSPSGAIYDTEDGKTESVRVGSSNPLGGGTPPLRLRAYRSQGIRSCL